MSLTISGQFLCRDWFANNNIDVSSIGQKRSKHSPFYFAPLVGQCSITKNGLGQALKSCHKSVALGRAKCFEEITGN